MDVIYSYKKIPGYKKKMDDKFYQMARISVNSAKKFYNTILYTDSECKKLFELNNVLFDEIRVLEEIENYKNEFYSVIKLIAMKSHGDSFIHIDLDTIITNPYDFKTKVGFGYPEHIFEDNNQIYWNESVMDSYYRLLNKLFPQELKSNKFDFTIIPNASLVYSKTKEIKSIIENIFDYFSESIWLSSEDFQKKYNTHIGGYSSLIEQFFIMHFLKSKNISFSFISEYQKSTFNELEMIINGRESSYGIASFGKIFDSEYFIHFQNYDESYNNFRYILNYLDESLKKPKTI